MPFKNTVQSQIMKSYYPRGTIVEQGLFISIEGTDACGKTSNAKYLVQLMRDAGYDVVHTREPGGCPAAEEIRNIILAPREEHFPPKAEALLYYASRAFHTENTIKPALAEGKVVISERYYDSTLAYQVARGASTLSRMRDLNNWVLDGFKPDLTILLDVDLETAKRRLTERGQLDRLEGDYDNFMGRARDFFLHFADMEPERFRVIDASQDLPVVQKAVANVVTAVLRDIEEKENTPSHIS